MSGRFCSQCGNEIPDGYSFCAACGRAQSVAAKGPDPSYQSNPTNPQPYQQPSQAVPQAYPQPYQAGQQTYEQPYNAGPQFAYGAPRVTSTKATGLIVGVFALVAAFILVILVFVLPSKQDFELLSLEEGPPSNQPMASTTEQVQAAPGTKYGEPPASILDQINMNATPEDYTGSYSGRVTFKSENLHIMSEVMGDSSYEDMLSAYNGKTFACTAETDDSIRAYSPEIYSDDDDGNFYTYYYFDYDLENGIALYEENDYDEEMQCRYYIADKAYFLTDGSIYVINITTAEFDDGRSLASEIRLELTPNR
jgi:hypothetical protein